jgi:hypothetical protein
MLHEWDNFYITTGAASASLIGLLFVVVTLGGRIPSSDVADVSAVSARETELAD